MKTKTKHVRWTDIVKISSEDLGYLREKIKVHPIVLKELEEPSVRTKVERYDGYLFLVHQFGIYNPTEKVTQRTEIDFIITKNEVVTIRYEHLPFLEDLKNHLTEQGSDRDEAFSSSFQLAYHIIQSILEFSHRQLLHIGQKVDEVSAELFAGHEQEVLKKISYLKRDTSEYRIIFRSQAPLFNSFLDVGKEFWGEKAAPYINDLIGDHIKITNQLEDYRAAIIDFEQTNMQLLNARVSGVMKTFTILAFSTFPLTLVAAVLSIPTTTRPIVGIPYDFWIITGTMAGALLVMFVIFKIKKWL